jgi:aminoglycoside phosphotransferase family enzyme/predicted kinase
MGTLRDDLLRPSAFPGRSRGEVRLAETHASWVFLVGNDVYKVKKPVDLGFLDFRTLEQRRAACEAEVRLNARLAPRVYLGVCRVRRGQDGVHSIESEGETVDWAVHMRRLDDRTRADELLARGELRGESIDAIARQLASFHASARCDAGTSCFGTPEAVEANVLENFAQTRRDVTRHVHPTEALEIEVQQTTFIREHRDLLRARIDAQRIRDGHGDLRLEHVYLEGGHATIIDCIEFNDRFRFADVCADVAFLSMDLAWHGHVDLAERLLTRYARESNDFDLYAVVDFYESYRAYVRAKVSMLLAADEGAEEALRARADAEARRYLLLALSAGRRSLVPPMLVCVGGLVASGKSTVADHLGVELGAPVVEADRTRKHMLGVTPTVHLQAGSWSGAYDPAFTERVYGELLRRAGVVLGSGRPVVVDASFRAREMRRMARALAEAHGVPFRFVECRASTEAIRERLARREVDAGVSDARLSLLEDFRAHFEPPDEVRPGEHVVLDTTRPVEESLTQLRTEMQTWPPGLVA